MATKRKTLPADMTIAEASEFWDSHSVVDFPSHPVQFVYSRDEEVSFVALANDLLRKMEEQAKQRGVSVETLLNLWIQERLSA